MARREFVPIRLDSARALNAEIGSARRPRRLEKLAAFYANARKRAAPAPVFRRYAARRMTTILGIRPSIQKVAKRGGQKPRRENGHANIEGQGDYKVIDAFAPLEKFHTGKRRRDRLVPINSRSFVLSAILDGNGVPSDRALF